MPNNLSASTVIGNIYEASYNPVFWPVALEGIAEITHANSAVLLYQDNELKLASGTYSYNISDENFALYNAHGVDPNFMIMTKNIPIGVAAAVDHIIPNRSKLEEVYGEKFTKLMLTTDLFHIAGAILFVDNVRTAGIGLQRTQSMGAWTKSQIDNLNVFVPHLQRAMNIQKEFIRLKTREQAFKNGLDKLLMGLILFDKELQPIYTNPVAKSILSYHPAIDMSNNKIYAHDLSVTKKIYKALVSAISSNNNTNTTETNTALGLNHPECTTTLPLVISPAKNALHGFEIEGYFSHAIMCFSDPDKSYPIEADKLANVYKLTSAEAQVAIAITNGMSPDEIAVMHEIAISTIRSQLRAIYQKLGINSQTELVKILLTGPFN